MKRLIDILLSAALLAVLAPLLLLIAMLVRTRLGSPVVFRQERIGNGERPFTIYKFRSMREGAGSDAERLDTFGRWLRATSLDELPELWNVLKGQMSLVGPRPLLPEYLPYYRDEEKLRHTVRPGLTGLAQVSGRNAITWDEKLALDADYVRRQSLALDAWILWRTFAIVLQRRDVNAAGHATFERLDVVRKGTA